MSFSVDELIASFASNHVGQEAIDLANLQLQLSQTLSYVAKQQRNGCEDVPYNTPTARTPSNPHWGYAANYHRQRSASVTGSTFSSYNIDSIADTTDETMETDDEYAVEQLVPSSPSASTFRTLLPSDRSSCSSAHVFDTPTSLARSRQGHILESSSDQTSFVSSDPFFTFELKRLNKHRPHVLLPEASQPTGTMNVFSYSPELENRSICIPHRL